MVLLQTCCVTTPSLCPTASTWEMKPIEALWSRKGHGKAEITSQCDVVCQKLSNPYSFVPFFKIMNAHGYKTNVKALLSRKQKHILF